jgi:hypothetical protein
VEIKTLNGSFIFPVCRLKTPAGSSNYLRASGQFQEGHYQTKALCAYCIGYACQLSYESVSRLVKERSGSSELSDQQIQLMVLHKAQQLGLGQESEIETHRELPMPALVPCDLYDATAPELYWLEDGVSVCKQKINRDKVVKPGKERTITDAIMLAKPAGGFDYLVAAETVSLTQLAMARLKAHYAHQSVSVVVISDGSRTIKNRCQEIFGEQYQPILDWYHLQKKLKELLSMIAQNKEQKISYLEQMLPLLWRGDAAEVIEILLQIKARNVYKQEELIAYLRKNQAAIIHYEKRKAVGKPIGSGAMEKTVDLLVASRQKRKAMSWSEKGSKALAVVKADLINRATKILQ